MLIYIYVDFDKRFSVHSLKSIFVSLV